MHTQDSKHKFTATQPHTEPVQCLQHRLSPQQQPPRPEAGKHHGLVAVLAGVAFEPKPRGRVAPPLLPPLSPPPPAPAAHAAPCTGLGPGNLTGTFLLLDPVLASAGGWGFPPKLMRGQQEVGADSGAGSGQNSGSCKSRRPVNSDQSLNIPALRGGCAAGQGARRLHLLRDRLFMPQPWRPRAPSCRGLGK